MAAELVSALRTPIGKSHPVSEVVLIPSGGGCFEVTVDGELIFSKRETGLKPDQAALVEKIRTLA